MTDTVTLPRSVVEQALEALKYEKDANNPLDWHHDKTMHALRAALEQPQGGVVVTTNQQGHCIAVTRQDEEGRILSVVWESKQPQVEQEPVGEAGSMPGTDGFTMACFRASDVPVGTKLYTHPQPPRQPLDTETWPEYPAPSVRPVYATSANTKSVRDGFEVGGYEKTPPLFTKSQLYDYALNVLRAHGIGGEA